MGQLCSATLRPLGPELLQKIGLTSREGAKIAAIMVLFGIELSDVEMFLNCCVVKNVFRRIENSVGLSDNGGISWKKAIDLERQVEDSSDQYLLDRLAKFYEASGDAYTMFWIIDRVVPLSEHFFRTINELHELERKVDYIRNESIFSHTKSTYESAFWTIKRNTFLNQKQYFTL